MTGKRWVECALLGSPCRRGYDPVCEKAECRMNKHARWAFSGMTRPMRVHMWGALQQVLLDNLRLDAAMHGKQLKSGAASAPTDEEEAKAEAQRLIADPMADFPDDVDYDTFDGAYLHAKQKEFAAYVQRIRRPITDQEMEVLWSPERVAAIRGDDPVARRAAVNGKLWSLYRYMVRAGVNVTVDVLRDVLRKEVALGKLFPDMAELEKFNAKAAPEERCNLRGDILVLPKEYIEEQMRRGTWDSLVQDACAYGNLGLTGVLHANGGT